MDSGDPETRVRGLQVVTFVQDVVTGEHVEHRTHMFTSHARFDVSDVARVARERFGDFARVERLFLHHPINTKLVAHVEEEFVCRMLRHSAQTEGLTFYLTAAVKGATRITYASPSNYTPSKVEIAALGGCLPSPIRCGVSAPSNLGCCE
jgi:hypothetical protein